MGKKGFVISSRDPLGAQKIASVNPSWYYNWGLVPLAGLTIPFVPMSWGARSMPAAGFDAPVLLGFNEPDRADQSNLTFGDAEVLWPSLYAQGRRLGSPATAENCSKLGSWLDQFAKGGAQFDFVCVHWYAPPNVDSFLKQIDAVYMKYKLPIWITEFAVADWAGKYPGGYPVEQVKAFMTAACAGLEARSYVERYSWKTRSTSDAALGTSALFNDDGSLTELGLIYSKI
jgi:hypothetical protein